MTTKFIRNIWYVAIWAEALRDGKLIARTFLDEPIVLFRRADGTPAALRDICPHRFAPLSLGKFIGGDRIKCAYHGLEFASSGRCVRNPHRTGIVPRIQTPSYPVIERHGLVWIWLGTPEFADPGLIPDFSILEFDPSLATRRDYLKMDAGYLLIADNLHDLSHTSFLHEGLLANEEMLAVDVKVAQVEETLHITRDTHDVPPPDLFRLLFSPDGRNVDLFTKVRWDAPGNFIIDSYVNFPGQAATQGTGFVGTHFLTPETATSTHYHFAAVRRDPQNAATGHDDQYVQAELSRIRRFAFEEQDQPMIEAQQRMCSTFPQFTARPALLEGDKSVARYRRILDAMLERESRASTQFAAAANELQHDGV